MRTARHLAKYHSHRATAKVYWVTQRSHLGTVRRDPELYMQPPCWNIMAPRRQIREHAQRKMRSKFMVLQYLCKESTTKVWCRKPMICVASAHRSRVHPLLSPSKLHHISRGNVHDGTRRLCGIEKCKPIPQPIMRRIVRCHADPRRDT